MSVEKIGIVGSGLIGRAWAMLFAGAGYRVQLYDAVTSQVTDALEQLDRDLHELEAKGTLRGQLTASEQYALISGTTQLKDLVLGTIYIQECIPEVLEMKRKFYSQLDECLGDHTVVGSSTSTFMPSLFSDGLQHRSQMLVAHPLNPPYFIPLVEIVPAPWTTLEVVERTRKLMAAVGQRPVALKREVEGFATNRIQYAILNEVWRLVAGGILSAVDVDLVLSEGLGLRYALLGALETAHLNAPGGIADYIQRFGGEMEAVSATYGPTPDVRGDRVTLAEIARQWEEHVPLDSLPQRRAARDEFLIRLAELKRQLDSN